MIEVIDKLIMKDENDLTYASYSTLRYYDIRNLNKERQTFSNEIDTQTEEMLPSSNYLIEIVL